MLIFRSLIPVFVPENNSKQLNCLSCDQGKIIADVFQPADWQCAAAVRWEGALQSLICNHMKKAQENLSSFEIVTFKIVIWN